MKTFSNYINEQKADKVWVVYDRSDIFINYYYTKEDAQKVADELNNETPSLKYHIVDMNRSELEAN